MLTNNIYFNVGELMKKSKIIISKDYKVGKTDDRLFGSFVEHMGATVYNGIFEPGHKNADADGFRKDVLSLVKELNLSMIRYPGGNFVSGFNWEDSVGPKDKRPKRLELAWKAIEPNTFGLNEFMKWIGQVSAEPIMTVNLGTRGADDAHNIVEYCNFDKGSYYSDLRRSHGIEKPYKIKTWCLGNEQDGPWQIAAKTADEYGRIACEAGKVMKWVDPNIELVAVGSSTSRMSEYPAWDKTVLMHTYEIADFISLHHYIDRRSSFGELNTQTFFNQTEEPVYLNTAQYLARNVYVDQQINDIIATCDYVKSVKRSKKIMQLSFDEWNVIGTNKHKNKEYKQWQTGSSIDCGAHSMEDSLAFASMMMSIIRRADRIKIACQSLLVNTGPLIVTNKDGIAWRNVIFYPFMHISYYGRGEVLKSIVDVPTYDTKEFSQVPIIDDLIVYNEEKGELNIFIVNRSAESVCLNLDLRDFNNIEMSEHIVMSCSDITAANTEDNPNKVQPRTVSATKLDGKYAESILDAYSWNVIRLKVGQSVEYK